MCGGFVWSCDTLPSDPSGGVCIVLLPGHVTSCCLMTVEVYVVLTVLACWVMADIAFGLWWKCVCVCVCAREGGCLFGELGGGGMHRT